MYPLKEPQDFIFNKKSLEQWVAWLLAARLCMDRLEEAQVETNSLLSRSIPHRMAY